MIKYKKTFIVAEIGFNFSKNINLAKKMILEAKKSGVDAVKIQDFTASEIANAKYSAQYKVFKNNEISFKNLKILNNFCKKNKIIFFTSVFGKTSISNIKKLNFPIIKIASGDITNLVLLNEICKLKKTIVLSTGMAKINEIENAIKIFKKNKSKFILCHCTSIYPTELKHLNLNTIDFFKDKFKCQVGLSDHSMGIVGAILSSQFSLNYYEKHFTSDKKIKGGDNSISVNAEEMNIIVNCLKNRNNIFGKKKIVRFKREILNKKYFRRGVYAKRDIAKGEIINLKNIKFVRPETSISIKKFISKIPYVSKKEYSINEPIEF